jgi:hypothetical protein
VEDVIKADVFVADWFTRKHLERPAQAVVEVS